MRTHLINNAKNKILSQKEEAVVNEYMDIEKVFINSMLF